MGHNPHQVFPTSRGLACMEFYLCHNNFQERDFSFMGTSIFQIHANEGLPIRMILSQWMVEVPGQRLGQAE